MSSHHFVKEQQEPAVFILDVEGISFDTVAPLLEWSPTLLVVQEAVEGFNKMTNEGPSFFMWRILDQGREPLRYKLAQLAGCDPEEIAINRNSTEALNTVIFGLNLKAGDEVIGTKQDYPNMINAWRQRASREGIVYTQLSFKYPIENDEEIILTKYRDGIKHIAYTQNYIDEIRERILKASTDIFFLNI